MSLTKDAIQHLQQEQQAVLKSINTDLAEYPLIAIPEGFSVAEVEKHMRFRSSYRFAFDTESINDFVAYSKEFDSAGAKCFIDAKTMTAATIFDLGGVTSPGHQRHTAQLELERTAAYLKLASIAEVKFPPKKLADFIEDWADFIEIRDSDAAIMDIAFAVSQVRNITIEKFASLSQEVANFSEKKSGFEKIEAKSNGRMPATMVFSCTPFQGLGVYKFNIKLSIATGEESPIFLLRVTQLEALQEKMSIDFKKILTSSFEASKLTTFIGKSNSR